MKMFQSKRASTFDNFYIAISFWAFALCMLMALFVWNQLTTPELEADIWDKTSVGQTAQENAQRAYDNLDWIIVTAYFGIHLGVIVMAFLLRSHPFVYVAVILLTAVFCIVAAPLSNVWEELTLGDFSSVVGSIPLTNWIMLKFPLLEAVWAIMTGIVLAGTARMEGYL